MIATKSVRVLASLVCLLLWPAHAVAQEADWERHMHAGLAAYRQGHYAEAEKQYKAGLRIAEGFAPHDPRLAINLDNMAVLYVAQGRYIEAEHCRSF